MTMAKRLEAQAAALVAISQGLIDRAGSQLRTDEANLRYGSSSRAATKNWWREADITPSCSRSSERGRRYERPDAAVQQIR
jgi:hypothetical protein